MSHAFINTNGHYMLELHDEILIEANAVAELERERIIKLLEGIAITTKHDEVAVMELLSAIVELIKGEQK